MAARILADVGDVARFADRNRFASWTGTAPLDASSGEQIRHRLSRAGNRRMNHVIHIAAIVPAPPRHRRPRLLPAQACRRQEPAWKPCAASNAGLSDVIYRHLVADADRAAITAESSAGPGGHCGATQESSAVDLPPHIDTSDQPLPGPARTDATRETPAPKDTTNPIRNPPLDIEGSHVRSGLPCVS